MSTSTALFSGTFFFLWKTVLELRTSCISTIFLMIKMHSSPSSVECRVKEPPVTSSEVQVVFILRNWIKQLVQNCTFKMLSLIIKAHETHIRSGKEQTASDIWAHTPSSSISLPEYQYLLRSFHDHSVPQQKHTRRWLHSNIRKNMTHKNNWGSFHLIIWTTTTWVSLSVSPLLAESLNHRHITMSESILPRVLPQHHLTWVDATLSPLSSTVLISFHCCDKKNIYL